MSQILCGIYLCRNDPHWFVIRTIFCAVQIISYRGWGRLQAEHPHAGMFSCGLHDTSNTRKFCVSSTHLLLRSSHRFRSTPTLLAHWMPSAANAPSCLALESFESEANDCPQGQLFIASCSSPVALELLIWDPAVASAALWRCPHPSRMWQTGVRVNSKEPWSWLWLLPMPWAGMSILNLLPAILSYISNINSSSAI